MNFRSIKKLSPRSGVTTIIKPEFNDWIGSRWRSGTGLFRSVLLSFQQPATPFGQMSWPQPRAVKSQFLFAPSIQLTFNSYPSSNVFSESHTWNTSQHTLSRSLFDVRNLLSASRTSNTFDFQSSSFSTSASGGARNWKLSLRPTAYLCVLSVKELFQRRDHRDTQRAAEIISNFGHHTAPVIFARQHDSHTTLHATERFFEQLAEIRQSRSVNRFSNSTERPTLITISSSVRHWAQFLSNLFHRSTEHRYSEKSDHVRSFANQSSLSLERIFVNDNNYRDTRHFSSEKLLNTRNGQNRTIFQHLFEAARSFRSWVNIRTIDEATHSRQTFLKQLNSQFLLKQSLQERSFASVVQKFVVSKSSSSSETMARQVQYFGPPPDLTYAKNESPQFQQLVTALRDFRPAQNETKAPAPQFPSIAQLTSQVRQELERELRIERERRGL